MIAALTGYLVSKAPSQIILDVHGVGYEIFIPLSTYFALPDPGERVSLSIHTHLRDNAVQLFGFLTQTEKEAFVMLIGISGVGGKLALSTLSTLRIEDLLSAILSNDLDTLTSVPGIGKKSAGRIALELKEKVSRLQHIPHLPEPVPSATARDQLREEAISALVNLGYRPIDVKEAVKRIILENNDQVLLTDLIRDTLKSLGKK